MLNAIRVSIADDHAVIRMALRRFLEKIPGLTIVGEAANGQDALTMVAGCRPDILILDLSMPILDGCDVIKALRKDGATLKIFVFSANNDRETIHHTLSLGANQYFIKDTDIHRLLNAIRQSRPPAAA